MRILLRFLSMINKKNLINLFTGSIPGALTILFSTALFGISTYLICICANRVGIEAIGIPVVLVRFFGIGRAVLRYGERLYTHNTTFKLIKDLRVEMLKTMTKAVDFILNAKGSSDTISTLISDVEKMEEFYLRVLTPILTAIFVYISLFVFLGWIDYKLFLGIVIIFILAIFFILLSGFYYGNTEMIKFFSSNKKIYHELNSVLLGLLDIIANGVQGKILGRISKKLEDEERLSSKYKSNLNFSNKVMGLLSGLGIVYSIWILGILAGKNAIRSEYIAPLAIIVFSSFEVLIPLGAVAAKLREYIFSLKNIFNIMESGKDSESKDLGRKVDYIRGNEIRVSNLSFTYTTEMCEKYERKIINFPDFELKAGQIKVLKGESGSGKYTLLNILAGIKEDYKGSGLIDTFDISDIKRQTICKNISYLRQKPYFFNTTIENNLKLSERRILDEEIVNVIQMVGMSDYIQKMPKGIDTIVGEFGTNLSGGELKRLAIARELLKNSPIMLLDEPFAWLDRENEIRILNLLIGLARKNNKAILIATHSLVSLEGIDEIIVLGKRGYNNKY